MACSKKRVRKLWENDKAPRIAKSSKYERNDPSVKNHWKNVIKEIESSYKKEKFWEKTANHVNELVGDVIFERIRKIFNLPPKPVEYHMKDEVSAIVSSSEYISKDEKMTTATVAMSNSLSNSNSIDEKKSIQEVEDEDLLSDFTEKHLTNKQALYSANKLTRSLPKIKIASTTKACKKLRSKHTYKSLSKSAKSIKTIMSPAGSEIDSSRDDLVVHAGDFDLDERNYHPQNPYHKMLYCKESETDMIQWKSNYKTKKDEIHMSDKYSQNIETGITKKIATEFLEWWSSLGTDDYRSELKRPEDIEALFQLWFDEQASRGLIIQRKTLPCVLTSVANHSCAFEKSCEMVLKTQILKDIKAEAIPAKTIAFNASLPEKMKHIPPWNNTEKNWQCVHVPEDLRSMACVWGDIRHLRSTKSFEAWLRKHPSVPMPPIFAAQNPAANMKQVVVVPVSSETANTDIEISIPFTHVDIELKKLTKLIDD